MSDLLLVFPDAERAAVSWLLSRFTGYGDTYTDIYEGDLGDVTVGVDVPRHWDKTNPAQTPHLQVRWDGTPTVINNLAAFATVSLVAFHPRTSGAKALAALGLGVLCTMPAGDGIVSARPLTGPQPARDPATGAEICSVTARVTIRSAGL